MPGPPVPAGPGIPGPYQQWGPPPAGLGYGPPPPVTTNGLSIAAFVTSIFAVVPVSIPLAFVGLSQIRRTGQNGRGFAFAALAVSAAWIILFVVIITLGVLRGTTSARSIDVGQCVNGIGGDTVLSVRVLPCTEPHEGEVVAVFDLPAGPFPGDRAVRTQVEDRCNDALDRYSPSAQGDPAVDLTALYPRAENWTAGDREVVCIAVPTSGKATGSIRGR